MAVDFLVLGLLAVGVLSATICQFFLQLLESLQNDLFIHAKGRTVDKSKSPCVESLRQGFDVVPRILTVQNRFAKVRELTYDGWSAHKSGIITEITFHSGDEDWRLKSLPQDLQDWGKPWGKSADWHEPVMRATISSKETFEKEVLIFRILQITSQVWLEIYNSTLTAVALCVVLITGYILSSTMMV